MQEDAAALGVILEQPEPEHFEIFPENWDVIIMWSRIATQWRTTMSGAIGLDYGVLQWVFSLYDVEKPHEMLENLQIMEAAVLDFKAREGD
ncbi:MAG: DUF1799 domain-containing protein [Candidatus Fonsibacter ubiquis]